MTSATESTRLINKAAAAFASSPEKYMAVQSSDRNGNNTRASENTNSPSHAYIHAPHNKADSCAVYVNADGANSNGASAMVTLNTEADARRRKEQRVLFGALLFCTMFMIIELGAGILAHSLALLTDAIHLLTDVGSYALSIGALIAASRQACGKYNYGWSRAEVIGTLLSVFSIWALVGWIVLEATNRTYDIIQCSRVPAQLDALSKERDPASPRWRYTPPKKGGWWSALHGSGGDGLDGDAYVNAVGVRQCHAISSQLMIVVGVLGMMVNVVCALILSVGGSHGHSHFGGSAHGHSHDSHAHEHHDHSHGSNEHHDHSHGSNEHHDHSHGSNEHHDHSQEDAQDEHGKTKSSSGYAALIGAASSSGFAVNAAFLHALGDCVQSLGVIMAGIFIYLMNRVRIGTPSYRYSIYNLADPISSIFFAVVTLNMTRPLLHDLFGILMESTPARVDYAELDAALREIEGVKDIHDLHVWSLSAEYVALSAHLVADNSAEVLEKAQLVCAKRFGIDHTTIQIDTIANGDERCTGVCGSPATKPLASPTIPALPLS